MHIVQFGKDHANKYNIFFLYFNMQWDKKFKLDVKYRCVQKDAFFIKLIIHWTIISQIS